MIDDVKDELVGFELRALALLLWQWSQPTKVKDRKSEWENKLPAFRGAVIAGGGSGSREKPPHELVLDDHQVVFEAIQLVESRIGRGSRDPDPSWLQEERLTFRFEQTGETPVEFVRPFPGPWKHKCTKRNGWDGVREISWKRKPELVAREIVAARLGCSESKVRDVLKGERPGRRYEASRAQQHLVSVLLDLCSCDDERRWGSLRAEVLDALYASRFHLLGIYYALQRGSELKMPIVMADHDEDEVKKLCRLVCPNPRSRPFSEIIAEYRGPDSEHPGD